MRKLSQSEYEELSKFTRAIAVTYSTDPVMLELAALQVGNHLLIEPADMIDKGKTSVANLLNSWTTKNKLSPIYGRAYASRKLADDRGWIITRKPDR